ncbi:hypothetical protein K2X30_01895 [bacterium]|jgi:NADH:ubiquinone oxidoreductase subunit 3 (subunit A)|nr:hypothetical protein [bacterium]
MPSGWEVYYVVFLSAVLALAVPGALWLVSLLVRHRPKAESPSHQGSFGESMSELQLQQKPARRSSDTAIGKKVNTRFFLGSNAALILVTLALILVPCVGILKENPARSNALKGLICIGTIVGFAALGLLYSARKGDLDWVKSFREEDET